jgi:hypothetical protein
MGRTRRRGFGGCGTGDVDIEQLPEDLARRLFEALRLEIRCDRPTPPAPDCAACPG